MPYSNTSESSIVPSYAQRYYAWKINKLTPGEAWQGYCFGVGIVWMLYTLQGKSLEFYAALRQLADASSLSALSNNPGMVQFINDIRYYQENQEDLAPLRFDAGLSRSTSLTLNFKEMQNLLKEMAANGKTAMVLGGFSTDSGHALHLLYIHGIYLLLDANNERGEAVTFLRVDELAQYMWDIFDRLQYLTNDQLQISQATAILPIHPIFNALTFHGARKQPAGLFYLQSENNSVCSPLHKLREARLQAAKLAEARAQEARLQEARLQEVLEILSYQQTRSRRVRRNLFNAKPPTEGELDSSSAKRARKE